MIAERRSIMSIIISSEIFQCCEKGETLRVEVCHKYIDFAQAAEFLRLRDVIAGRKVEITGKTSVAVYFMLGYWLTMWNARSITGIRANDEAFSIELDKPLRKTKKKWLCRYSDPNGQEKLEILEADSPTGKWSRDDLELNTLADLEPLPFDGLHISGLGSVLMYLLLGISAAKAGLKDVFIAKPTIPYEIHISANGQYEAVVCRNSRNGIVIGVLGDPNSGKSVFSHNFAVTIRKTIPEFASWLYDCDLASPTPEWYLTDSEAMKQKRQDIKQKWSVDLERKVVRDLCNLRQNLDLTLADMPGGRKRDDGTLDRIPSPSRADMMAACDAFIILCRKDRADEIFCAWKTALAEWHLEDRIVAKLISADPDDAFSISPLEISGTGLFTASISGLDRKKEAGEVILKMETGLESLIRHIASIRKSLVTPDSTPMKG